MLVDLFTDKSLFMKVLVVYRPDSLERQPMRVFIQEFSDLVAPLTAGKSEFIICGDFNIHMDVDCDREAIHFRNNINPADN